MQIYEKLFKDCLDEYLENKIKDGEKRFIILPMGDWGKIGRDLLRKKGIEPIGCFDNFKYDMKDIYPLSFLEQNKTEYKNAVVLILTIYKENEEILLNQIKEKKLAAKIFLTDVEMKCALLRKFKKENPLNLDFLCVGFPKCGTTSLHAFLEKNEHIGLPKVKETQFIYNITSKTHKFLHESYDICRDGKKIWGGIEPIYSMFPRYVKEYFGKNLKIIFCIRNPVNTLYSQFKMEARNCVADYIMELYKKYDIPSVDMFREYIDQKKKEWYCYSDYIEEWLEYYSRENMIFLVSEEVFQYPNEIMKEFQLKIGLTDEEIVQCKKFPHDNKGKCVTKNYEAAQINKCISDVVGEAWQQDISYRNKMLELRDNVNQYTLMEFDQKMPQDLYDELLEYYMPSIKRLEEIMGRSLEGLWY